MEHVRERGYKPIELPGADRLAIGVLGSNPSAIRDAVVALPGVLAAIPVSKPYKMVGLEWHPQRTVVDVGGVRVGDGSLVVAAGPCAVESETQLVDTAVSVAAAGAELLRGGAYKPRSSPYSFRGLGAQGLDYLQPRARADRPACGDRGAHAGRRHGGRGGRRHAPGGHAQRPELQPARGGGGGRQAGAAQARAQQHCRGMAAQRGVRASTTATRTSCSASEGSAPSRAAPETRSTSPLCRWSNRCPICL